MNYYPHHIGDFRSGTFNMTRLERWIYRDMLEVYYDTEAPLSANVEGLCKDMGVRSAEEKAIVADLLTYKFKLTDAGYINVRCDLEIVAYHAKSEAARENGKKGGRKPNPNKPSGVAKRTKPVPSANPAEPTGLADETQSVSPGFENGTQPNPVATGLPANQEPRTNNQEKNNPVDAPPLIENCARGATPVELSIAMRKQGVNCQPADPRLIALADQGVTVATASAACVEAKQSKPDQQVIALGYVVAILKRWGGEAAAIDVAGATPPPRAPPSGFESAKDRARRTTIEAMTGKTSNERGHGFIDINDPPVA